MASHVLVQYAGTVKVATEAFVTNKIYEAKTNIYDRIDKASSRNKTIAMFIIPLNMPSLTPAMFSPEYTFAGFELKASTNNFNGVSQNPSLIQFYSDSAVADQDGSSLPGFTGDKMKLFTCNPLASEFRAYSYIGNTSTSALFDYSVESVVVIIDASCLRRHPGGGWLSESNENLSWCFIRTSFADEHEELYDGQFWHPIAPVRWFGEMPEWAIVH